MAMLIDGSGVRRLPVNPQAKAQEERVRFRQAVQDAVAKRARSSEDPRMDRQQPQERLVMVERGDTLTGIANTHEVKLAAVAALNPQVRDVDHIETGEVLFIPSPSPTELAQRPDGNALFLENLHRRGNAIEYANAGEIDHLAEIDALAADVGEFVGALPEGDRKAVAQRLFDQDWTDAGPAQMAIEQGAEMQGIELEVSSHKGSEIETQARERLAGFAVTDDPAQGLANLNASFKDTPPGVQQAMLRSPVARDVIKAAGDHALSALTEAHQEAVDSHVFKSLELMRRLDEMSTDLDPKLTGELAKQVLPGLEDAYQASAFSDEGPLRLGTQGTDHLLNFTGRLDPKTDLNALDRFAAMGFYQRDAFAASLSQGGNLNYPLALVRQYEGDVSPMVTESGILDGMLLNQQRIGEHITQYGDHLVELNWLEHNGGSVMTDAQIAEAVDSFVAKDENWKAEADAARAQLAQDGLELIDNLGAIEARYPELFEGEGDLDTRLQAIENASERDFARKLIETFDTPEAVTAMGIALDANPDLLTNPDSMGLVGQYGKLTDRGRKFVEETATQILRSTVVPQLAQFDPANPKRFQQAKDALEGFNTDATRRLLGVSDADLDNALKVVKDAMPQAGETTAEARARLQTMDKEFDRLTSTRDGVRAFNRETPSGQVLRLLGVMGSSAVMLSSVDNFKANPDLWGGLKVMLDGAGVAQKTTELLMGAGMVEKGGTLDKLVGGSNRAPVKALGVLSSLYDFSKAWQAGNEGNAGAAAIHTTTGVGGVMAALGTGSVWGPIGVGVVLVGTGAQIKYDQVQEANKYQTQTTVDFLKHAGFSDTAAQTLSDQSGKGYSVLPLLERYADSRGLDLKDATDQYAFVSWVNDMPEERLAVLRDNLHRSLDEVGNDLGQIPVASKDDEFFEFNNSDRPHFTYTGYAKPLSMNQLDTVLDLLELDRLTS